MVAWVPDAIPKLEGWVRKLASTSSYSERCWRDLAKGRWEAKNHDLRDNAAMRPPPLREKEAPKTAKDKKKRRASSSDTPKPKKSKARKSKNDTAALSANVAQKLGDEEEKGENNDCELVARKRRSVEASKTAEPVMVEEAHLRTKEISEDGPSKVPELSGVKDVSRRDKQPMSVHVHHDEHSAGMPEGFGSEVQQKAKKIKQLYEKAEVKEVETLGWKQNMYHFASEKDTDLETRLAVELAKSASVAEKVKAEAKAVVVIYRADAEAANARSKETFDVAQVRLSRVVEHAKCQYRRETLEDIHARGFDLTVDIENAKMLETEAEALLSYNDDSGSASGSESGEDEDEALEDD
ncbi:uncharacterized protein [Nicotiana sylvestris]|uniref:uncharacterized protein n=1 Tax=Nicotiana sylvestris TaxID=4096 RepID=UPI00388C5E4D